MEKITFPSCGSTAGRAILLRTWDAVKLVRRSVTVATKFTLQVRHRVAFVIAVRVNVVLAFARKRFRLRGQFALFLELADAHAHKSCITVLRVV
jgi:hypothetical protein